MLDLANYCFSYCSCNEFCLLASRKKLHAVIHRLVKPFNEPVKTISARSVILLTRGSCSKRQIGVINCVFFLSSFGVSFICSFLAVQMKKKMGRKQVIAHSWNWTHFFFVSRSPILQDTQWSFSSYTYCSLLPPLFLVLYCNSSI